MNQISSQDYVVAPNGRNTWSGRLAEPNAEGTDGPFATLERARDAVRADKFAGKLTGPITVWLRGGVYKVCEPLRFHPDDSGPITYAAYPGEHPVLDGGKRIRNWRVAEHAGMTVWVTDLPEVADGTWYFRQLFVNGERRTRAHLPKLTQGTPDWFWMEDVPGHTVEANLFDGANAFVSRPQDIQAWPSLRDAEVVVLHYWTEDRLPVASFDPTTRLLTSTRWSIFALRNDYRKQWAKYYIDNLFEGLTEPGEWYLDRSRGQLFYLPLPGETLDHIEVVAPVAQQLLVLAGCPDMGQHVEYLRFQGLSFAYTDWEQPTNGADPNNGHRKGVVLGAAAQSAYNIPGVVRLEGARFCAIEHCTIHHIGGYGIELGEGCVGNRIVGNTITDMGAGGIKVNGGDAYGPRHRRTGHTVITDNTIHHGGRVFHSAAGILAMHTFGNHIAHNHIHDLYHNGISCGWVWGDGESVVRDNRIEKNHIHDLGHGWLTDMAGIYTLGVQPGTVIRSNHIHDVTVNTYGGCGIYTDEGSAHIVIEHNICYNVQDPYHHHVGRENIVRNNIFVGSGRNVVSVGRATDTIGFTLERNILIALNTPLFQNAYGCTFPKGSIWSDYNVLWAVNDRPIAFQVTTSGPPIDLNAWHTLGHDRHSVVADPCFTDDDFTLAADSPAHALGFDPIDLSDVGPRPL
jgi:hypothetical protein